MGVRRQARESALQALYMCDCLGRWMPETVAFCFDHFGVTGAIREYAEPLCCGIISNISAIDSKITCASDHWSVNRMGRVDRAILRIAVYEIIYVEQIPRGVAINEAIEVAKRFSTVDSPMFINGVLDRVAENISKINERSLKSAPASTVANSSSNEVEIKDVTHSVNS